MAFKGYKYKVKINISHGLKNKHAHTLKINAYISIKNQKGLPFKNIEELINQYFEGFNGKFLDDLTYFKDKESTIENIGKIFYKELKNILKDKEWELIQLEISEIPTRVFIVNDNTINNEEQKNSKTNEVKKILSITEGEQVKVEEISKEVVDNIVISNKKIFLKVLLASLLIIGSGILFVYYMYISNRYPQGSDVYGHLFKANVLYNETMKGNIYPLYTDLWYNGEQLFRYWPPLAHYYLALFQFLFNGDMIKAYLAFIGSTYIVGAFGWLVFGIKEKRIFLGTTIGILFFFLPDNMRVCFSEGNVPRIFITALLVYNFSRQR